MSKSQHQFSVVFGSFKAVVLKVGGGTLRGQKGRMQRKGEKRKKHLPGLTVPFDPEGSAAGELPVLRTTLFLQSPIIQTEFGSILDFSV